MHATTAIVQDTRRTKKNGTYPVKLRITFNREQKYYLTPYNLTIPDFEKVQGTKPRNEFKETALWLQSFEKKAADIIHELPQFSWMAFEKKFLNRRTQWHDVFAFFESYIDGLKEDGRISYAENYETARNTIRKFVTEEKIIRNKENEPLPFELVTVEFLEQFERWMLKPPADPNKKPKSKTTAGIYIRPLRAIFNIAMHEGIVTRDQYPFGKHRYQIPGGSSNKRAITISEVKKIFNYQPHTESEAWARDMWLFSYLGSGINVKDMALLKYKNIERGNIKFIRAKTVRTTKEKEVLIIVPVDEHMQSIIGRWGNKPPHKDRYIFGIMEAGATPKRERELVQYATKTINKYMKRIAVDIGIEGSITTYVARHTYSTILMRSGASTEFIQKQLGHRDKRTTENYLGSFEDETKKELHKALTAFSITGNE